VVVLHEVDIQPEILQGLAIQTLIEEAPLVPKEFGVDEEDIRNFGGNKTGAAGNEDHDRYSW